MAKARYRILRIRGGVRVAVKNTSRLPDTDLDELLRAALHDVNVGPCAVHVVNYGSGNSTYGKAYYQTYGYGNGSIDVSRDLPSWCRHLIIARWGAGSKGRFVNTLAHEAKHIEEYREGRRVRNGRTRQTEVKARAFGQKRQREYEQTI